MADVEIDIATHGLVTFYADGFKFMLSPCSDDSGDRWLLWNSGFMWGGFRNIRHGVQYAIDVVVPIIDERSERGE